MDDYDKKGRKGSTIIMNQPAIFKPDPQGKTWQIEKKGEIGLES